MQTYQQYKDFRPTPGFHFNAGALRFEDADLVYSATARCRCGAGLAFVKDEWSMRHWWCSALLKSGVIDRTDFYAHDDEKPFYTVSDTLLCEYLPDLPDYGSVVRATYTGETTRPNASVTRYVIYAVGADGGINETHYRESDAKEALFRFALEHTTVALAVQRFLVNATALHSPSAATVAEAEPIGSSPTLGERVSVR